METAAAGTRSRLDSLTGLRFFAAFAVFVFHILRYGEQSLGNLLFTGGATGVAFFFVVSGFVMSWTARPGDTAWAFYRRRFARIYPAYLVAWLLTLGVLLVQGRRLSGLDLVPLTLLQSWVPSASWFWATNAVFWSLSVEAFFYLAFPLLHRLLAPLPTRAVAVGAGVAVLVPEGIAVAVAPAGRSATAWWAGSVLPVARLPEFVLGMLLATLLARGVRCPVPLLPAAVLALAAMGAAGHVPPALSSVAVVVLPYGLLVWSAATTDLERRASVLRGRQLVTLGAWSYALYLVHTQAVTVWFEVLQRSGTVDKHTVSGPALLVVDAGALGCALLTAWLVHRLVEVPMERRLRPRAAGPHSLLEEVPVRPLPAEAGEPGPVPAQEG